VGAWSNGSGDVIEFAASSAATVGEALKSVLRYVRILNEAAEFSLSEQGDMTRVELRSRIALNRQAADFQMGTLMLGMRTWLGHLEGFEISFAHAAPPKLDAYAETFAPARVSFGAAHDTATFNTSLLDSPIASANPALHKVLLRHAAQLANELPESDALTPRVRKLIVEILPSGTSDADFVAHKLGMSRRTLTRHLEREQTSFKGLLETTRHEMARQYLRTTALDPQQIAFLLGYSMTAAFSRAFARWEGRTPTEYRRTHSNRR
jgi:AraC-like DNA-binding protein